MSTISLRDFAITGQFGPVKIGMTRSEIINLLGKPDHEQNFDTGSSGIMYAWYEFFYWTGTEILYAIQNDHLTTCPNFKSRKKTTAHEKEITYKNDKFEIDIWFLKIGIDITYKEVVKILNKEKIRFKEMEYNSEGYIIEFDSGVRLDFDDLSGYFYKNDKEGLVINTNKITDKNDHILNGIRLFKP